LNGHGFFNNPTSNRKPLKINGAPGVIRTPGTRFRKPLLYPPELQGLVLIGIIGHEIQRECMQMVNYFTRLIHRDKILLQHFFQVDLFPSRNDAEFIEGLGFDLPHPLARNTEFLANAIECLWIAVTQPETQFNDLPFAH
jgi:hypothetical protein